MRTLQLHPRIFTKGVAFQARPNIKFTIPRQIVTSTHMCRIPMFTKITIRKFADVKVKPQKPANVNTDPLDVNSNLNILQGLMLAGEYASVDNRIQKILRNSTHNKIKIELWNLMLSFYASQRNTTKLESILKLFGESKVQPKTGTFVLLLQYFGSVDKMEEIEKLISQAESATYPLDLPLIFHTAIASSSHFNKMYELAERMKSKKLVQNSDTLMAFIASAIRQKNIAEMEMAIKRFRDSGIEPHADAYIAILSVHHEKNNTTKVRQYLHEIKKKQLDSNPQIVKFLQKLNLRIPQEEKGQSDANLSEF